ncbi:hypothetical protein SBA3_2550006 [Candidatus Sulfopaludibacter sp. SbA3]|nr:hypothetical protein SBA3_2550006 [Candidatus Sulfopaludibacter sp. SbA3]
MSPFASASSEVFRSNWMWATVGLLGANRRPRLPFSQVRTSRLCVSALALRRLLSAGDSNSRTGPRSVSGGVGGGAGGSTAGVAAGGLGLGRGLLRLAGGASRWTSAAGARVYDSLSIGCSGPSCT